MTSAASSLSTGSAAAVRRVRGAAGRVAHRLRERELIYLVAPAGHPNYGDELIARTWLRYLARTKPRADVILDCHTPGGASVLLRGEHPRLTVVDTLWRMSHEQLHAPADDAAAFLTEAVANPGVLPLLVDGIELLRAADTIHFLGGGYINDLWPYHFAMLTAAVAAADGNAQVVATGQGLIPVGNETQRAVLTASAAQFAVFDVRDAPSAQVLAGVSGLRASGDDAWLAVADAERRAAHPTYAADLAADRKFVLCLQSDLMDSFADGAGVEGLRTEISDLLQRWQVRGADVAVVECIPRTDRRVFDQLIEQLSGTGSNLADALFVPFTQLWHEGLPAYPGQVWISTRFHPHLMAAAAGAAGVAIAGRSDYYPIKHSSLIDGGSRWTTLAEVGDVPPQASGYSAPDRSNHVTAKLAVAKEIYS